MSAIISVGTPTVHVCETVYSVGDRQVVHVVLPPRQLGATPLTDIRDAGHDVLSVDVFPSELPECSRAVSYPGCTHVVLRSTE